MLPQIGLIGKRAYEKLKEARYKYWSSHRAATDFEPLMAGSLLKVVEAAKEVAFCW
jgi:hypothetical protein